MFVKNLFVLLVVLFFCRPLMADSLEDTEVKFAIEKMKELHWENSDNEERQALYNKMLELSDELSKNTQELEDNTKAVKENEQSLINRTLGAASMGAAGIGGMMLGQSLAEQRADANAEEDMRAYLETFRCEYGDGKSFKGGTSAIELPGGNQLATLYKEYMTLAADVKATKEALNMTPGIESEVVLDKTKIGLYDDVSTGKTGGAFASLARALTDETSEDAKKIAEQKSKTASNLKTGAITAGAGVAVGAVGNLIANKDFKNNTSDLVAKRDRIVNEYNVVVDKLIDKCNATIREHKEFVASLSADKRDLLNSGFAGLQDYISVVENAKPISDILEFKENPLCY